MSKFHHKCPNSIIIPCKFRFIDEKIKLKFNQWDFSQHSQSHPKKTNFHLCLVLSTDGNQVHPVIFQEINYQLFPKFCRLKNKFQTSCWEGTLESPCQNYKIRQFTFLLSNQCSGGQPEGWKEKKFEQGKIKCKISFRSVLHFDLCTVSVQSLNTIAAL